MEQRSSFLDVRSKWIRRIRSVNDIAAMLEEQGLSLKDRAILQLAAGLSPDNERIVGALESNWERLRKAHRRFPARIKGQPADEDK